ncbi:hypothetical protein VE00_08909 [Pseudogymnoascus sp. WSF 3629]|jgi:uncharacterized protein YcsI (UPF0317 family)|nr:hypothetical protein VE00_08909 [Pseudogymnoascus sp. WSF 3629]
MIESGNNAALSTRLLARHNKITLTSGLAPKYLQANLIILPSRFASDFLLLCHRNPVPCPLLASSRTPGSATALKSHLPGVSDTAIASALDICTDAPLYMVYDDGKLVKSHCSDIAKEWTDDHVAFLIGCSYSFEAALTAAGLPPRHTVMGRNVPMYATNIPLCAAGVFTGGTYVVSMRPYRRADVEKVRELTRPYVSTHGEPVAWGWDAVERLGIKDINAPEFGDMPLDLDPEDDEIVPVFWGCGVTPQLAVMKAQLPGRVMGHAPGHMLVIDVMEDDIVEKL